jgi:hypothetical protein
MEPQLTVPLRLDEDESDVGVGETWEPQTPLNVASESLLMRGSDEFLPSPAPGDPFPRHHTPYTSSLQEEILSLSPPSMTENRSAFDSKLLLLSWTSLIALIVCIILLYQGNFSKFLQSINVTFSQMLMYFLKIPLFHFIISTLDKRISRGPKRYKLFTGIRWNPSLGGCKKPMLPSFDVYPVAVDVEDVRIAPTVAIQDIRRIKMAAGNPCLLWSVSL